MVTLLLTGEERALLVYASLIGGRPIAIRAVKRTKYDLWPENMDFYLSCGHTYQVGPPSAWMERHEVGITQFYCGKCDQLAWHGRPDRKRTQIEWQAD
jgi:hypothetical protein